jgi:uncharacterized membrane protein YphA (DoxX/SURF4 family)
MTSITREILTDAPPAVVLVRVMVGAVFLSEGIQKFLLSEADGLVTEKDRPQ